MEVLEYPFQSELILKKRKSIKKELLNGKEEFIIKKIAILGGSTTYEIKNILELFLLKEGIKAEFYESEYNKYWEDVIFDNQDLVHFKPDLIYIHTTTRNIIEYPNMQDTKQQVDEKVNRVIQHFINMWDKILSDFHCPIIQNNFEQPIYRVIGNSAVTDYHGRIHFINQINEAFYQYAQEHDNFFINDINYLSACYGLEKWADSFYWYMYKYAVAVPAIPELAFNISNIIKSIFGKNKKALVLDLDNTLWGGIIGDDGVENIEIGQETSVGQAFSEIQNYFKLQKDLGIILTINSKNEEENAIDGLSRPDSILKPEDFFTIKANWKSKDNNIIEIAEELNIGIDSLVFIDDNPAERDIVRRQLSQIAVPEISKPEYYLTVIDRMGYFELTNMSEDDKNRNKMYEANKMRKIQENNYSNYNDYLQSLEMKARIKPFESIYLGRIAQLTNKSNQFNLTTKRYTQEQINIIMKDNNYITLYGKLVDKFGDNGIVSVVFGRIQEKTFHIEVWLMSCRVLKRDMEYAMMDELAKICIERQIESIYGYYYPTVKNKMVKDFYKLQGFSKINEDGEGNITWKLNLKNGYEKKNQVISINDNDSSLIQKWKDEIKKEDLLHGKFLESNFKGLMEDEKEELEVILSFYSKKYTWRKCVKAYLLFIQDIRKEQLLFVRSKKYHYQTIEELEKYVYSDHDYMEDYMIGLALSTWLLPVHYLTRRWFRNIINKLQKKQYNYLEIGVGHGIYFADAVKSQMFQKYVGIDISNICIEMTKELLKWKQVEVSNVELKQCDFFQFNNERLYDFIVLGEILEHVENPKRFLEQSKCLLKDGGLLYMTTVINTPQRDHIYHFKTPNEINQLVLNCKFDILDSIWIPAKNVTVEQAIDKKISMNCGLLLQYKRKD